MTLPFRTGLTDLTDDELLLFDFLSSFTLAFHHMRREVYATHMNTRYTHGLSDQQLQVVLDSLCDRKLVTCKTESIFYVEEQIYRDGLRYALTEKGGAQWEVERQVDWNTYVECWPRFGVRPSARFTSLNEEIAKLCAEVSIAAGYEVQRSPIKVRVVRNARSMIY